MLLTTTVSYDVALLWWQYEARNSISTYQPWQCPFKFVGFCYSLESFLLVPNLPEKDASEMDHNTSVNAVKDQGIWGYTTVIQPVDQ